MYVTSEYAEVGGENWGEVWVKDRDSTVQQRAEGTDRLIGECCDIGAGHFEWNPDAAPVIAMFLKKAVTARVPDPVPMDRPAMLNAVDPASGVLIDPRLLGTEACRPTPAKGWNGNPREALWYLDDEMAEGVNRMAAEGLGKRPQVIDFLDQGKPISLDQGGGPRLPVRWLNDGVSFRVEAGFLDKRHGTDLRRRHPRARQGADPVPRQHRHTEADRPRYLPSVAGSRRHRAAVLTVGALGDGLASWGR